jgi:hypothetical protein
VPTTLKNAYMIICMLECRDLVSNVIFLAFGGLLAPFVCGLLCGLAGYKKDREPQKRTSLSNRGARVIRMLVQTPCKLSIDF